MSLMKRFVCALVIMLAATLAAQAEEGFRSLFNGKDLSGWDGNPELWSVEDGCIIGKTTGPEQLTYNQFLIWRGGVLKNFELRARMKLAGSNSGIQYRSREFPETGKWSIGGYQCDVHPTAMNNAMVFGEKAGGVLVRNGQSIVIEPEGKRWLVAEREPVTVDTAEWHEYTIVARGNHLVHKIDGRVTTDLLDFGKKTFVPEGLLAFQLHRGPAMKVQIKDVLLKELPDEKAASFDKALLPASAVPVENGKSEQKGKVKAADKPKAASTTPATMQPALATTSTRPPAEHGNGSGTIRPGPVMARD